MTTNSTDRGTVARFASRLNRHALGEFYAELSSQKKNLSTYEPMQHLPEAGEDVYYQPYLDSYGGSIHDVALIHAPPFELFQPDRDLDLHDPVLMHQLAAVRNLYHRRLGSWGMVDEYRKYDRALRKLRFIANLVGIDRGTYDEVLIPAYARLRRFCGLRKVNTEVGSWDSFIELDPEGAYEAMRRFVQTQRDGLAVSFTANGPRVDHFASERNVGCGVLPDVEVPYEPVIVSAMVRERGFLAEFETLLQHDPSEAEVEAFIRANFENVLGPQYDRIESQLWLRCPDVDIRGSTRRLDLFLRNSVTSDWELFEIKRPRVHLTTEYRNVPVLAQEVVHAVHQASNYLRDLSQDAVKRRLAAMGVEYYEPTATLVIGRSPAIPLKEWRWLKSTNEGRVQITTYDDLLHEWRSRLKDRYQLLDRLRL
jgi:hypothetical protein